MSSDESSRIIVSPDPLFTRQGDGKSDFVSSHSSSLTSFSLKFVISNSISMLLIPFTN